MISGSDVRVRIDASSINFPSLCPLCGGHTTKHRYVSKTKMDRVKQAVDPRIHAWRRTPSPSPTQRISLDIPVCDEHYKSPEELRRSRGIVGIIAGVSMPLSIMLAIYIGFNWYDGVILPPQYYLVFILSLGIFLWSARKLGGTDLERAISILDFVQGNPAILIRMRAGWYAEEFLKSNPTAKVVSQKHKEFASND